jgi:hypothetical protein
MELGEEIPWHGEVDLTRCKPPLLFMFEYENQSSGLTFYGSY